MRYVESLNKFLHEEFAINKKIYLIGEDLNDPYGGAFKVSKGLSSKFPNQIISSPISESAIIGLATGIALADNENCCICEIMFADFVSLALDQIINHLVKFKQMYRLNNDLNVIIRIPSGAYRSYGPTHSQSLESLFFNIPNLLIISPSIFYNPGKTLNKTIKIKRPVLFVENKTLYSNNIIEKSDEFTININNSQSDFEIIDIEPINSKNQIDVTIISYGYLSLESYEASKILKNDYDINVQIIVPLKIFPFEDKILNLIKSNTIFIIDETLSENGWSQYILGKLFNFDKNLVAYKLATKFDIIPSSKKLEKNSLIYRDDIVSFITNQI